MRILLLLFIALCFIGCRNNKTQNDIETNESINFSDKLTQNKTKVVDDTSKSVNEISYSSSKDTIYISSCQKDKKVTLVLHRNQNGQKRSIQLVTENRLMEEIKLPSKSEYNNFSLNWIRENNDGFEISIEWGTRVYIHKTFYFSCQREKFYFKRIKLNSFDKREPETDYIKDSLINFNVPLSDFKIHDYMTLD